jgi:hypothetical protein
MRAFTRLRFWRIWRYRLSILGVCVAYLLAALEIPLPVFAHKDSSQPFPCQNHPCGCQTAEQCWQNCCCFTAEERWAWARAHNVEPPAYAEKPAEKPADNPVENAAADGWSTPKLRDRGKPAAKPVKSCCSASRGRSACCAASKSAGVKESPSTSKPVRWKTALSAWRCRGYATVWVSAGSVLPVLAAAWSPDETPRAAVVLPSIQAGIVPSIPPDPPPRLFTI